MYINKRSVTSGNKITDQEPILRLWVTMQRVASYVVRFENKNSFFHFEETL
jgi:hypothetical protein